MAHSETRAFALSGFAQEKLPAERQDGAAILGPLYAFLRYSVGQFHILNKAEIEAAARKKSYLAQRRTVNRMRDKAAADDENVRGLNESWHPAGKSFALSLPELA